MTPTPFRQLAGFALVVSAIMPLPAGALAINSPLVPFTNSASVTDGEGGTATANNGVSLGTSAITQFNPSQGVLLGATVNVTSIRTQTTQVTSTAGGGTGANSNVASNGIGSSTANISAPGVNQTFSTVSASDACTGKRKNDCTDSATSSAPVSTNLSAVIPSASLDGYVGVGNVTATRTAPILTATQADDVFTGIESTQSVITWTGNISATYDYLLHAAPSFDDGSALLTLDLDFGTLSVGQLAVLGFDIFNLPNVDRVGMDLDGLTGIGDTTKLFTDLVVFDALVEGSSSHWLATLDTSIAGIYKASYSLALSDADVGAASSRANNLALTLNLTGVVVERERVAATNGVPEPTTLALLGMGIAGLAASRRRYIRTAGRS